MNRIILITTIFLSFSLITYSQCNNELTKLCLKEIGDATYLKEFPVKLKKGKKNKPAPMAIFSLSLKKGSHYRMNVKNDVANKSFAIIQLSDDYKLYGSTYDKKQDVNHNYFDFLCRKSGRYYLTIHFKDKKQGCAVAIISLVEIFNTY